MILADTSVWIDYFRKGDTVFERLLEDAEIAMHPMVLGELVCGNLARRDTTIRLLKALPQSVVASDAVVLHAIESHRWFGSGVGWTDAHLLTAALLSQMRLLTTDARLARLAAASGVEAD